jgi:hypothetical protein
VRTLGQTRKGYLQDHPYEWNVFIMMRYGTSDYFGAIERTIKNTLSRYRLFGHLARDQALAPALWDNIRIHMDSSRFGIAVFEDIDERYFNPNVSLELGYMLARRCECLLLKECRMNALHTDLCGRLYHEFDALDAAGTVPACIEGWLDDLGITRTTSPLISILAHFLETPTDLHSTFRRQALLMLEARPDGVKWEVLKQSCFLPGHTPDSPWRSSSSLRLALHDLLAHGVITSLPSTEDNRAYRLAAESRDALADLRKRERR